MQPEATAVAVTRPGPAQLGQTRTQRLCVFGVGSVLQVVAEIARGVAPAAQLGQRQRSVAALFPYRRHYENL